MTEPQKSNQAEPERKKLALHWKILIGLVAGAIVGVAIAQLWTAETWASIGVNDPASFMAKRSGEVFASGTPSEANAGAGVVAHGVRVVSNVSAFVGQLFFQALRFIAVPIVFCAVLVGVASLGDLKRLGRVGLKAFLYFVITGACAMTIGLALANAVKPGHTVSADRRAELTAEYQSRVDESVKQTRNVPSGWQTAISVIPPNPFTALTSGQMLQVIFFALAIGVGLTMIDPSKSGPVITIFEAFIEVILKIIGIVMVIAPFAVFALVAQAIVTLGLEVLGAVAVYAGVVMFGLALVLFGMYPLILRLFAGVGYRRYFKAMAPAMLTAFSSSSSSATLPVTISCVTKRLGASNRVAGFVCPIATTINMDGTAMYQGIAALFIAQMYNVPLTVTDQVLLVLTALMASLGTPGIPGAGIVMLVIILESRNIPAEGIAVILGVDRVLDMMRTVVNVAGDSSAVAVVARSEGELLTEAQVNERNAIEEASAA